MEHFAPKIMIKGITYTPKGYEWVLGFALAGCGWALKKASEPEFLKMVRADLNRQKIKDLEITIQRYENKIAELKNEIDGHT